MKDDDRLVLVRRRLEQAQTALDDAEFLLDSGRSSQSIINRSYYAMFYAVLALLQLRGRVPSKHAGVISLFDTEYVLTGAFPKELSKDLHKAFEVRQVSDYRVVESLSADRARDSFDRAVRFVSAVSAYLQGAIQHAAK